MAKKPTIKGTTVTKRPKKITGLDRRNRVLNTPGPEDVLAKVREEYYGRAHEKQTPEHQKLVERIDRVLNFLSVEDVLTKIREEYYRKKQRDQEIKSIKPPTREERLSSPGIEQERKRRMTTSGMNTSEARKVLAEEIKRGLKK